MKKMFAIVAAAVVGVYAADLTFEGRAGFGFGGYNLDVGADSTSSVAASMFVEVDFLRFGERFKYGVAMEGVAFNDSDDKTYKTNTLTAYELYPLVLRYEPSDRLSFYTAAAYTIAEMGSVDLDGYALKVGVDYDLSRHLFVGAYYAYEDLDPDSGNDSLKTNRSELTFGWRF